MCGNSGRSPEPHLHFQIQSTPHIGSKTISYPIAYFFSKENNNVSLKSFVPPNEGAFVSNVISDTQIQEAYNFQPGFSMSVSSDDGKIEDWEVLTNIFNESYFYCESINAFAYFINNGTAFYFTNYIGPKNSLLYYFYLSSYKIMMSSEHQSLLSDAYPISDFNNNAIRWIQDLISPFYIFIEMKFECAIHKSEGFLSSGSITIDTTQSRKIAWNKKLISQSSIKIEGNKIQSFSMTISDKKLNVICTSKN